MEQPRTIDLPIMRQRWSDVTFVHWRIDPGQIAPHLPAGVVPEEFDGSAWVGLVPFVIDYTSSAGIPFPAGAFPETNVRVYVRGPDEGQGVVFLSLDAARILPVVAARSAFGLPYVWARMRTRERDGVYSYLSRRWSSPRGRPDSVVRVRPVGGAIADDPLAEFLTARWALYSRHLGRTLRLPLFHDPWLLRRAEGVEINSGLVAAAGIYGLHDKEPDSVLFSPGVVTVFGPPTVVA